MLHLRLITTIGAALMLCVFGYVIVRSQSSALRRITDTAEESISLNPSLSGDGRHVAFESTEDIANVGGSGGFHALRADITNDAQEFTHLGATRAPAPAISQDGSRIAFASKDDPLGTNPDGNSEIFFHDGATLRQFTDTSANDASGRTRDGNFQPSISDDGRFIAFTSNRDLMANSNPDGNYEIFVYDAASGAFSQLTNTRETYGATAAKISGDGSRIAYISESNDETNSPQRDVMLLDREGGTTRIIAFSAINPAFTPGRAISDDGTRVAFAADTGVNRSQVFLFDARDNSTRQLTSLSARVDDVPLHPTICGDGSRIAFATRRNVNGGNSDVSIELYAYDIPARQFLRVTDAPAAASGFDGTSSTARKLTEVVSSLNDDGTRIAFNFPRALSGAVADAAFANNTEIYLVSIPATPPQPTPTATPKPSPVASPTPTPTPGVLSIVNGASFGTEPANDKSLAPASLAIASGRRLADAGVSDQLSKQPDGSFPQNYRGTTLAVNNRPAQLLFVSATQINFIIPEETESGTAQVVVTNRTGAQSRGTVTITRVAPGIFTQGKDGSGEAVALDADSLTRSPFDPTSGTRRLIIFTTGLRRAARVSVSIGTRLLEAESATASADLAGMDEVRVRLPADLTFGVQNLIVHADARASNTAQITINSGALNASSIVINEFRTRGTQGASDEFIELYNNNDNSFDISGWKIKGSSGSGSSVGTRLTINDGTVIPPRGYFLATNSSSNGYSGNTPGDQTYSAGIADDGGIALTTPDDAIVDQIGLSNTSAFKEGTPLSPLTTNTDRSYERKFDIEANRRTARDTNDNATDFQLRAPGTPQNSSSVVTPAPTPSPAQSPAPSPAPTPSPTPMPTPLPTPVPGATSGLVISQIYGGGGNSGAPLRCDYVEIFNRGSMAIVFNETPFSVQYTSAGSNFSSTAASNKFDLTTGRIAPGQYFLVQGACGATGAALPAADAVGSLSLAATAGKVALVSGTSALAAVSCPGDPSIADFVGYGSSANCSEGGTPAPAPGNAVAISRSASGCADTNNNAADFAATAPAPRNNATPLNSCNSTPSPTPSPTPTPTPAPTPTPTPVPTPTPTPTPTPVPLVSRIVVAPATATVNRGMTQQFTAQAFDASGNIVTGVSYTWSSGNAAIASVNDGGLASGLGIGRTTITATASNGAGGRVNDTAMLNVQVPLVINEILADVPPDNSSTTAVIEGDANRDGVRSSDDDEFVELLNNSDAALDLSGIVITDEQNAATSRFIFPQGTMLAAGRSVVVFGGAQTSTFLPNDPAFGGALVLSASGSLGLNDAGDTVTVKLSISGADVTIATVTFGSGAGNPPAPSNQSLTRSPDAETNATGGNFIAHSSAPDAAGRIFSPGGRADGTPFGSPAITRIEVMPASATLEIGATQTFNARAFNSTNTGGEIEVPKVSFVWDAIDPSKASVAPASGSSTTVTAIASGQTMIRARAANQSGTGSLTINRPPPVLTRLTLTAAASSVTVGNSTQFTAQAFDQYDQPFAGATIGFATSDNTVATIDTVTPNSSRDAATATITGRRAGTAQITATATSGSNTVTSNVVTLTVTNASPASPSVPTVGQVVINEVVVSVSSSAMPSQSDFVELLNKTNEELDISGLAISFRGSGTTTTVTTVTLPGIVGSGTTRIPANGYFLIARGSNTFGVVADFDAGTTFDLNGTTGAIKIEINNGATMKLDGLSYQTGSSSVPTAFSSFGEGSVINIQSSAVIKDFARTPNGADTNDNATDFRLKTTTTDVTPKAANP
ncbi:MAG: lamin tail domain-containing protein [Pyrinomonadaceae bacterium]